MSLSLAEYGTITASAYLVRVHYVKLPGLSPLCLVPAVLAYAVNMAIPLQVRQAWRRIPFVGQLANDAQISAVVGGSLVAAAEFAMSKGGLWSGLRSNLGGTALAAAVGGGAAYGALTVAQMIDSAL